MEFVIEVQKLPGLLIQVEMAAKESKVCDETLQVLRDQWKCRICENGPRAGRVSWYKCNAEHSICQDCYKETCQTEDNLEKKICNEIVLKKPCKLTEALLSMKSMRFMCVNESRGCKEILDKEAMIYHEAECIYRLIPRYHGLHSLDTLPFHEVVSRITTWHSKSHKLALNEKGTISVYVKYSWFYIDDWIINPRIFEVDGRTFISSLRQIATKKSDAFNAYTLDHPNYKTPEGDGEAQFYHWIH